MADIDPDVVKAVLEAQGNNYDKMKADAAAILQNSKDLTEELTKQLGVQREYATAEELRREAAQQVEAILEKEIAAIEKKIASLEREGRVLDAIEEKRLADLKEKARLARVEIDSLKTITELQGRAAAKTQNMLESTLGLKDTQEDFADLLIDTAFSSANLGDVFEAVTKTFEKMFTVSTILKSIKNQLKDMAAEYEKNARGAQSFNARIQEMDITLTRTMGATKELGSELKAARQELLKSTYVADEVEGAFVALTTASDAFNQTDRTTRLGLSKTAAMLGRFGVSADTTAESIDNLVFGMNQTPDAAAAMTEEMSKFARQMGFKGGPNALLKEFNSQLPLLARYGKNQGVKIFKALAVTAKKTGIEMGKLVEIAGQFDTFEGAAEAAGKLNMVLGGPMLNSIELLNATEEERIQMLKDGVAASGKSFEQMGRFERDLLAQTLGVSTDVAAALFTRDLGNIKEATASLQAETDAADSLSEEAEKRRTLQEKETRAKEAAIDATKDLNETLNKLDNFLVGLKEKFAPLIGIIGAVAYVLGTLGTVLLVVIGSIATIIAKAFIFKKIFGLLGIKIVSAGALIAKAFKGILIGVVMLGKAFVAGGKIIGAALKGIVPVVSMLGKAFVAGGAIIASVFKGILFAAGALASFILTPFGLITAAVAGLAFFFRDELGGAFDWLTDKIKALGEFFSKVISGIQSGIKKAGKTLDFITSPSEWFANGVTGYQGGTAMVGERGPEMVTLPAGSNVITNENVRKMAGDSNAATSGVGKQQKQQTINVVLKLDSDVLARHSAKVARDVITQSLEFG